MPKVSIVTPSYNHARFLPDRANSILGQTFQDFEWIIIDDCYTDGSQDVLHNLVGDDRRVTLLFHSQNMGMAAATREAIALSSARKPLCVRARFSFQTWDKISSLRRGGTEQTCPACRGWR